MNFSFYTLSSCLLFTILAGFVQLNTSCTKSGVVEIGNSGKTYLALGDSYTIGQSIAFKDNYPEQTIGILNDSGLGFAHPQIIATTGWTTGDLLNAIASKPVATPPYNIVTLLIGVNNQYQGRTTTEYQTQFTSLLQNSIAYAGNKASHVFVLSIPDYAATPFGRNSGDSANISTQIDAFNAINKQVSQTYGVVYIDVTDSSREAGIDLSLVASDGLHYSAKEYKIWSMMLADSVKKNINN